MLIRLGVIAVFLVCLVGGTFAQAPATKPAVKNNSTATAVMTNQDVLKLAKAGFSDDLILSAINGAAKTAFDLDPDRLVALKLSGVTERVIGAMLQAQTVVSGGQLVPAARAADPSTSAGPSTKAANTRPSDLPSEVGIYRRVSGVLREVQPELVNWRTGGMLKRMATAGLAGGHVNGWVANPRSPNGVTLPIEFVIYAPEGTSVTEYQLLKFNEKATRREFRAMSMSVVGARSGADANAIEFASDKVAPRTYVIHLENLPSGEYGFLPPGLNSSSLAASGKVYSFSIR